MTAASTPDPPTASGGTNGDADRQSTPSVAPPRPPLPPPNLSSPPATRLSLRSRLLQARPRPLLLLLGLLGLVLFSPLIGPVPIPWQQGISILFHQATGGLLGGSACSGMVPPPRCTIWVEIVWGARVPAVLLAVLVGAALGLSGGALQGVFRNPLADPFLLGLSSGATLGAAAAFAVTFGLVSAGTLSGGEQALLLPGAAFAGGLVPGLVVLLAAMRRTRATGTLLLTGVSLNFLFSATLSIMMLYYQRIDIQVTFWLLGGFTLANWTNDGLVLSVLLVAGLAIVLHGRVLNLLQLGEEVAQSLGSDPSRVIRRVVLLATVTTAIAVAFAGIIGFVGLVGPHIVRRMVGFDYRRVLPLSAAAG
ncbi:MAG: iron ABC transporter permease, partial [Euryarchaeota archaeon]|nr:iron ABC transporter permease [Euryarchaeota archaeon]